MATPLEAFRIKYHLTRADLLNSLINRGGEPISERTLRGLLSGQSQLSETTTEENAKNLAETVHHIHSKLNLDDLNRECRAALLSPRSSSPPGGNGILEDPIGSCSRRAGWSHSIRTLPLKGEHVHLTKARKLSDALQGTWSAYKETLYPDRTGRNAYTPERMDPRKFLEWTDKHFLDALDAYEKERDLSCGKWFLLQMLSWTESACHRIREQLEALKTHSGQWRAKLKEAKGHVGLLQASKERRMWLELRRLENLIKMSERWLGYDQENRQELEVLLAQAEENSAAWIELFEEVEGNPSFAVPECLMDDLSIRRAVHQRWLKVVGPPMEGDAGNWPVDHDPLVGLARCKSPLWPFDAALDAFSFELADAWDVILLSDQTKRHLFYVPKDPGEWDDLKEIEDGPGDEGGEGLALATTAE